MAVDSAVMVLDCAKGIEPQTKKLFAVCRKRNIPIMTFINKMDLPGRHPYELLEEIEQTLGMTAVPFNWPIGEGSGFQGLYDLQEPQVLFFQRTLHNQRRAPMRVETFPHPSLAETLGEAYGPLQEEIALLTGAGTKFDRDRFLAGQLTPVFFGSALTNFGVEPFLNGFLQLAPPPGPRMSSEGLVQPTDEKFSGFVFKIQANMDPQHRDRMAFLRIVSGRFEKDMMVYHARLDRKIRMTRPHRLFGRDRETIEEAYPGDVVGLVNPGLFAIGDTLCSGTPRSFDAIPQFPPECFGVLRSQDLTKQKQFQKGLQQLEEEGVMQVFYSPDHVRREPVLAAVGELQFDVVASRLESEYGVKTIVERMPFVLARWVSGRSRRDRPHLLAAGHAPARGQGRPHGHALRLRTAACLLHERICLPQVSVAGRNRKNGKLTGRQPCLVWFKQNTKQTKQTRAISWFPLFTFLFTVVSVGKRLHRLSSEKTHIDSAICLHLLQSPCRPLL